MSVGTCIVYTYASDDTKTEENTMRRITLITLAIIVSAGMAFAYGGMGRGMGGCGCGMGAGYMAQGGMGMGKGMGMQGKGFNNANCPRSGGQNANIQPVTKEEAKKKADEFVAKNLKGYKIDKTEEFQTPRFKVYSFTVKDASGNTFMLRVNPWGNVMGPFVAQQ